MKRIRYSTLALPLLLGVGLCFNLPGAMADSPPPGEEYPVVWWAQNHVPQSLQIFRFTTAASLEAACKSGTLEAPPGIEKAWASFAKGRRRLFCQRYSGQTHHLLGEAPYFMVSPPGAHK